MILSSPAESSLNWPGNVYDQLEYFPMAPLTSMGVITKLITLFDDVLRYLNPYVHGVHMRAISHRLVMIL